MPYRSAQALALLMQARKNGRLGHAYLITGPKEAGREAFAASILAAITGRTKTTLEQWRELGVPVIMPYSKSRRISVDAMRELEHEIHLKPGPLGFKFGVVVDCERMNDAAQNAFLKTLEEPPSGTLLLLLTGKPQELLPTTLSRVIEIELQPEPGSRVISAHEASLLALLKDYAGKSSSGGIASALALKSGFSEILSAVHSEVEQELDADYDKEVDHYKQTTDSGAYLKAKEQEKDDKVHAIYLQNRSGLMDTLLAWLGDIARIKAGAEHLDLPEAKEVTAGMAQRWSTQETLRRVQALRKLEGQLHTNVNEPLALEVGFMDAFA